MNTAPVLRFGIFEFDCASGELRRGGRLVKLPPQPSRLLRLLVENAGDMVDRERIRREIWGETSVDFDRSVNVCIAQIRAALQDDADNPRFVETLPRRGYRFLVGPPVPAPVPIPRRVPRRWWAIGGLSMAAALAIGFFALRPARQIRIAVLPFSGAAGTAQVDGLFDELLTRLGGIQPDRLRVIGRRSVARFHTDRERLSDIRNSLDLDYLLEATVRAQGPNLRINARLIQGSDETALWSETFTQNADAAAFEERFVAQVSSAVLLKLFGDASSPSPAETTCVDGWESYRTGKLLAGRGTLADLESSVPFLEKAGCTAGRVALAEAKVRLARLAPRSDQKWTEAQNASREAVAAAPTSPAAHLAEGNVALWREWNWTRAAAEFQRALRANPSNPDAHHDYAWLLLALGKTDEGVASLRRALALDPLSARTHNGCGVAISGSGPVCGVGRRSEARLTTEPRHG